MDWQYVKIERHDRIATVRFRRDGPRNTFSRQMMRELTEAARSFETDSTTTVVILTTDASDFCVGFDLKEGAAERDTTDEVSRGVGERRVLQAIGPRMCQAWASIEPVTIAAVEGWCIGGGMALIAALDMRVGADDARFYIPEIERGMNMSWQSIPRLVSLIGAPRTRRLTMMAQRLDAATALDWQLLDETSPHGGALSAAQAIAQRIAAMPPVQIRMCKEGINAAVAALHQAVSVMDRDQYMLAQSMDDHREGVRSFFEKRPARFSGR